MTALRPAGRTVQHPARYSPEVLEVFRFLIPRLTRVHDPFAGTGERLGRVADDRPWFFTGTELEEAFIVDHRVAQGDATDPDSYPWPVACGACGDPDPVPAAPCGSHVLRPYTVVTSPVYPNGMADDFVSSAADTSERKTYRHAKAATDDAPCWLTSDISPTRNVTEDATELRRQTTDASNPTLPSMMRKAARLRYAATTWVTLVPPRMIARKANGSWMAKMINAVTIRDVDLPNINPAFENPASLSSPSVPCSFSSVMTEPKYELPPTKIRRRSR